ncbi:YtpR family tRNA-binding protein [Helicobacter felis]|uniref:phenylalanine--tRNA ligase n=1 Tax=Helicobacter felis (strain ATCC 49179 / CCUG 28539 / NCTC 12436 / CS1) TaxID=936155 RepID=E7ACE3_HELFC|nr:phenylalanine--tRNA ligase subunit beta [Helicobacter felis]CBY83030.1 phenylalanyl-tRNA synthetase beta chain [Helicobacter felis ATCC 49179]
MLLNTYILQDFLEGALPSVSTLCADLSRIGLEVESVTPFNLPAQVVVGKILECIKHPNAEKLSVCQVDNGKEILQIVCGAKNVKAGQLVALALQRAHLPACNLHIQPSTLRGVQSFGMLCSSVELGLPKLYEGILILDSSLNKDQPLKLGTPLKDLPFFTGTLLDIALTPNRGDCLSVLGVARELSALYKLHLKTPPKLSYSLLEALPTLPQNLPPCALSYGVLHLDTPFLPLGIALTLALQHNLQESWIANLLEYSTYLSGVILQAYPSVPLQVHADTQGFLHTQHAGKNLATIGVYAPTPPQTSPYLLEASFIEPSHLCQSLHKHPQESTPAIMHRTQRGSNPQVQEGLEWLASVLARFYPNARLQVSAPVSTLTPSSLQLSLIEVVQVLGMEVSLDQVRAILEGLGFGVEVAGDALTLHVPPYRHDIEGVHDIAEEILRFVGIDNAPKALLHTAETSSANPHYGRYRFERNLATKALALGFREVVHYLFANKEKLKALGYPTLQENLDLLNPINQDFNTLRTSLIPGLLEANARNKNLGFKSLTLFELGNIYNTEREERASLAFLASGLKTSPHYPHPKGQAWDFYHFAHTLSKVIGAFSLESITSTQDRSYLTTTYHPYQSAWMIQEGRKIGVLGAINPVLVQKEDLLEGFIAEIDRACLHQKPYRAQEFSKLPTSFRDLTLLVDKNCCFANLKQCLLEARIPHLKEVFPLDIYTENAQQIALSLRLKIQSQESLTDTQLQAITQQALGALERDFNAKLK